MTPLPIPIGTIPLGTTRWPNSRYPTYTGKSISEDVQTREVGIDLDSLIECLREGGFFES